MNISQKTDSRLKLGNFFLASIFAVVPTTMTIAFLTVHGFLLCRTLDNRLEQVEKLEIKEACMQSNYEVNFQYILWIWVFTMIPTWRWFYIGHYKRVKQHGSNQ